MARTRTNPKQNDILSRVTELGHEALSKLSEVPGGSKVVEMMNDSKTRLDEMQKKLRGLDELERRVARLEQQLAATSKPAPKQKSAAKKAARKPATPKSPPA